MFDLLMSEKIATGRHLKGLESKNYDDYLLHKSKKTEIKDSITTALEKHLKWLMLGNKRLPADIQAIYLTEAKFKEFLWGLLSNEPSKIRLDHKVQKIAEHNAKLKKLEEKDELTENDKKEMQIIKQQIGKLKKEVGRLIMTLDDRALDFAEIMIFVGMSYITAAFKAVDKWTDTGRKFVEPLDSNNLLVTAVIAEIKKASEIKRKLEEYEKLKRKSSSS